MKNKKKKQVRVIHKKKLEDWELMIQKFFGNGEKVNETISGYLGDLLYVVKKLKNKWEEEAKKRLENTP